MTSVDSNFNVLCGRPSGADPLRVDVIHVNGRLLMLLKWVTVKWSYQMN